MLLNMAQSQNCPLIQRTAVNHSWNTINFYKVTDMKLDADNKDFIAHLRFVIIFILQQLILAYINAYWNYIHSHDSDLCDSVIHLQSKNSIMYLQTTYNTTYFQCKSPLNGNTSIKGYIMALGIVYSRYGRSLFSYCLIPKPYDHDSTESRGFVESAGKKPPVKRFTV